MSLLHQKEAVFWRACEPSGAVLDIHVVASSMNGNILRCCVLARCSHSSSVWMLPVPEKQRATWHCLQLLPALPTACITGPSQHPAAAKSAWEAAQDMADLACLVGTAFLLSGVGQVSRLGKACSTGQPPPNPRLKE